MTDRRLLYASAGTRALATGMIGVLMGVYPAKLGYGAGEIGLLVGIGLAGAAAATLAVTLVGDRLGRRRVLIGLSLLGAAGGALTALATRFPSLAGAAFLGMVNGMGRDRGASLVLEQAALPGTTTDAERTRTFAWYNVLQDAGHALGGLAAGLPALLHAALGASEITSFRASVGVYALLLLAGAGPYLFLSAAVEAPRRAPADGGPRGDEAPSTRLTPEGRRILVRISALFALDSLGGGFLTTALLSYFFYERFGVTGAAIGALFFLARAANAASHLAAAWLARRIGLLNTMVFTHVPSSLLLMTVPLAPSFLGAALLFLLREGLVEMDVPTRQSYVMAVVRPEERTAASGLTHLVRMGAWAVGPVVAGPIMESVALATPLFVGAAMKIAYDGLLYAGFRRVRPPEEARSAATMRAPGRSSIPPEV